MIIWCVCLRACVCVLHGWFFSVFYIHSQICTKAEPRAMKLLLCLLILIFFSGKRTKREDVTVVKIAK